MVSFLECDPSTNTLLAVPPPSWAKGSVPSTPGALAASAFPALGLAGRFGPPCDMLGDAECRPAGNFTWKISKLHRSGRSSRERPAPGWTGRRAQSD